MSLETKESRPTQAFHTDHLRRYAAPLAGESQDGCAATDYRVKGEHQVRLEKIFCHLESAQRHKRP